MLYVAATLAYAFSPNDADVATIRRALSYVLAIISAPFRRAAQSWREDRLERLAVAARRAAMTSYSPHNTIGRAGGWDLVYHDGQDFWAEAPAAEFTSEETDTILAAAPAVLQVTQKAPVKPRRSRKPAVEVTKAANAPVSRRIARFRVVGSGAIGMAYEGGSERQARATFDSLHGSGEVIHLYKGSERIG